MADAERARAEAEDVVAEAARVIDPGDLTSEERERTRAEEEDALEDGESPPR